MIKLDQFCINLALLFG